MALFDSNIPSGGALERRSGGTAGGIIAVVLAVGAKRVYPRQYTSLLSDEYGAVPFEVEKWCINEPEREREL